MTDTGTRLMKFEVKKHTSLFAVTEAFQTPNSGYRIYVVDRVSLSVIHKLFVRITDGVHWKE